MKQTWSRIENLNIEQNFKKKKKRAHKASTPTHPSSCVICSSTFKYLTNAVEGDVNMPSLISKRTRIRLKRIGYVKRLKYTTN